MTFVAEWLWRFYLEADSLPHEVIAREFGKKPKGVAEP